MRMKTKYLNFLNSMRKKNIIPIVEGDYVTVINLNDLNPRQLNYLQSKSIFQIDEIITKNGVKYADVGYNIPLKLSRFQKIENPYKYRVLFLQFGLKLGTYGEPDTENFFRNLNNTSELFPIIINEKLPETRVDFYNYSDLYRLKDGYYIKNINIKEYDFIFFGFMSNYTNIANLVINYVVKNNIPHMKYETFNYYHNKAYQFDLLEDLGYPYIPSVMTTKLTPNLKRNIASFGYPMIVKDVYLDQGKGVFKMNNEEELVKFFQNNNNLMLIQKFIPNDGEFRVITVKNKVQLIAQKENIEDVNKLNIDNRKSKKGTLPANVIQMCEDVSKHLFSDIIGFDIIQDKENGTYYIMETNASPHFAMFSIVTGVNLPDIIANYIVEEIKKGNQ